MYNLAVDRWTLWYGGRTYFLDATLRQRLIEFVDEVASSRRAAWFHLYAEDDQCSLFIGPGTSLAIVPRDDDRHRESTC